MKWVGCSGFKCVCRFRSQEPSHLQDQGRLGDGLPESDGQGAVPAGQSLFRAVQKEGTVQFGIVSLEGLKIHGLLQITLS
jgi:hypothetical protein